MPRRPSPVRRWMTAATWPAGVGLTSWDYLWRTTPMHRREILAEATPQNLPPPYPPDVSHEELQTAQDGYGPLFHRRYRTRIREGRLAPLELMRAVKADLNAVAPTKFARFQRVLGDGEGLSVGDELVVRMPGPWDGPVRVVEEGPDMFRLATLAGHLEAGQIRFSVHAAADAAAHNGHGNQIVFEIESWARSAGRLSNLLYHHVRMAKEIQLHMWISFLEGAVNVAQGKMTGGIEIDTWRVEDP